MKIKILKDYYCLGYDIYKKDFVDLQSGLTVLVGCNGSGKSTLLRQLSEKANEMQIPQISYNNLRDGQKNAMDDALNVLGDLGLLANLVTSSEGEQIYTNFGNFTKKIGYFVSKADPDKKEIFILLDAIDSGLSIDLVSEMKNFFAFVCEEEKKNGKEIYFVVSSNEYELCDGSRCLILPEMEYVSFSSYQDYKQTILDSREYKDQGIASLQKKKSNSLNFQRDIDLSTSPANSHDTDSMSESLEEYSK